MSVLDKESFVFDDHIMADSHLIEWLLTESNMSRYEISYHSGISESTLSRISSGETKMDSMRFGFAGRLSKIAKEIQKGE